ncbi:LacI family DNA-binding transcriptional regulator [Paenibacillus allorhizosphaerae]|uniref:Catabolite control protein A n=1 Tax=Paenibacillus allorhizosphaerae TaxID=2849866 RepID=A0ABM8VIN8_9BACL|nr:LacI family DNA-binding transcriptional regulator [Paenibacillus allorhizosphaerae]CAG7644419.1 Catabolite control protein A [Paenibacillus allorhizosphaerae]
MSKKNASIYDIAKEAGVSTATVSRTINTPDKVSSETRTKIHSIMERLNYSPNALAQSLVSRSTRTIGVFIATVNNPYYAEMVHVIEKHAFHNNYSILLGNTGNWIEKEEKYVEIFVKKQVDGIIFVGGRNVTDPHSHHIMKTSERIPVVLTNHALVGKNIYCVLSDEAEGACMAVQHLIDTGRDRIAYINGFNFSYPSVVKKDSYIKTLSRNQISVNEDLIVNAPKDNMEGGYAACEALLEKGSEFNGIFVANDMMAVGVMKKLTEAGYAIPGDVSVVGYDDIQLCHYLTPSLSSVTQNISKLGSMAVQLVNDVLEGKEVGKITYLHPELKIRESSLPH